MKCKVIESGRLHPQKIMDLDAELLKTLQVHDQPMIHFYEWDGPSVTHGYFTDPGDHLNLLKLDEYGIRLARRPTGGGVIFHLTDFAFSVFIPSGHEKFSLNTLENYGVIHKYVSEALRPLMPVKEELILFHDRTGKDDHSNLRSFCMAQPTQYDLVIHHKKVGGAAQRRTKNGYLHQGSISLALPSSQMLEDVIKNQSLIIESMKNNSFFFLGENYSSKDLRDLRILIKTQLTKEFVN